MENQPYTSKTDRHIHTIGNIYRTNCCGEVEIIQYIDAKHVIVKFLDTGYMRTTTWSYLQSGTVRDPTVMKREAAIKYDGAKIGEGKYKPIDNFDAYTVWVSMLKRCYTANKHHNPRYIDCYVCTEWHNFQHFAEWYVLQNNQIRWELDKDIIVKNNKVYSPSTCAFVPKVINALFTKNNICRGEHPIGVCWDKVRKKYSSYCGNGRQQIRLGFYNTEIEAFEAYKTFKELVIKDIALEYKNELDTRVFEAMCQYKVELTD